MFGDSAREGLGSKGVAVWLTGHNERSLAFACGSAFEWTDFVPDLNDLFAREGKVIHFVRFEEEFSEEAEFLEGVGAEVAIDLSVGDKSFGMLVAAGRHSGEPYTSLHLEFLKALGTQAAMAIKSARLSQELVAAERFATLGRIRAELAHEIGKPLGALELIAEDLPDQLDPSSPAKESVQLVASLSKEMRKILEHVLDSSRRGDLTHGIGADIEEAVGRAVVAMSRIHGEERVSVRIAPGIPKVRGDLDGLARVFSNLLDNALLSSKLSEIVEVSAVCDGETVVVEIVDHGSGMELQVLENVFEPFFSQREADVGNGLGLPIARQIVEGAGGTLKIQSTVGQGTNVRVELPCIDSIGAR